MSEQENQADGIVEYQGFWIIDGNYFTKSLYNDETARLYASTLKNCFGCVDCINCENCSNCCSCNNCIDCDNCELCSHCKKCSHCHSCFQCSDCKNCANASWFSQCNGVVLAQLVPPLPYV